MAEIDASRREPVQYRITLPVVLAFVACMLSIYLLGQHVYRYGSGNYAQPGPAFSETEEAGRTPGAVAVAISSSPLE